MNKCNLLVIFLKWSLDVFRWLAHWSEVVYPSTRVPLGVKFTTAAKLQHCLVKTRLFISD